MQPDGASASKPHEAQSKDEPVTLPPNVSIYTGPSIAQLLQAKLFTRIETPVAQQAKLATALGSSCAAFSFQHQNVVIIFDDEQDTHHEHFREVCLRLKDHDLGVEFGRCVFDAESALQAGIQLEVLNSNAVCMSHLMHKLHVYLLTTFLHSGHQLAA
jgi:hypothetical protein